LQNKKDPKDIIEENQTLLLDFQKDFPVHKDTDLFPAFFNFIECYLNIPDKLEEVKKYLIVGLSKLLFANKKEAEGEEANDYEDEEESKNKTNKLRSRLDLLFARFHLVNAGKNFNEGISKLSNSIILYSEIYGPESVGLTPHYYFLASYFSEKPFNEYETQDERDIIIKNIYSKIAEVWKKYFLGEKSELFESKNNLILVTNVDNNLNLIIGDYYVKKIISRLRANFSNDKELELKIKIIRVLILKELGSELFKETLNQVLKLRDSLIITDRLFLEDLNEKLVL
jgi:hypothetical protein